MEINSLELYRRLLRFGKEWEVVKVELDERAEVLHITIDYRLDYWADPSTGEVFPLFDRRAERTWRHLDCMDYQTVVHCRLPRIKDSDGKVKTIDYDWAAEGLSYTKKFENRCVEVLQATHCQKTAASLMRTSDDKICGVMHTAVERGLARRDLGKLRQISLDEKSYGKGHQYITVLTESKTGAVLDVERDRTEQAATRLLKKTLNPDRLTCITESCCDMWEAFMNALKKTVQIPRLYTTSFTLSSI
jgi:transposase